MADPLRLDVFRKDDFLVLSFELFNIEVVEDGTLRRSDPLELALIIVHFPPQHIAEEASALEPSLVGELPQPPVPAIMAGESRLVFRLPEAIDGVLLTLEALLDWRTWTPILAPGALPPGEMLQTGIPSPAAPSEHETALEIPWRLLLSPDSQGSWRHEREVRLLNGKNQLWRTHLMRMATGDDGTLRVPDGGNVRAIASVPGAETLRTPLSALLRDELVQLTSNYGIKLPDGFNPPFYLPMPIRADQLTLSTLGATVRLEGKWDYPLGEAALPFGLRQFRQISAQGRDHFVQSVEAGIICCFGNRSTVTLTVERVHTQLAPVGSTPDGFASYGANSRLMTSAQIDIQQPEIDYRALAPAYAFGGREMPFQSVRILTTSARIVPPDPVVPSWLMQESDPTTPVLFQVVAKDLEGKNVEFSMPLMFVPNRAFAQQMLALVNHFRGPPPEVGHGARQVDLGGQEVAFAPEGTKPGSTVLRTASLDWDIETSDNLDPAGTIHIDLLPSWYSAPFLPRLTGASAVVPSIAELIGDNSARRFRFDELYLEHGFDEGKNAGQSFAQLDVPADLAFASQKAGGLAQPSSVAAALSRTMGPIASAQKFADREVDLSAFTSAKFLGTIKLTDILPGVPPQFDPASVAGEPPSDADLDRTDFKLEAPRLVTQRFPGGAAAPEWVETRFLWKPRLRSNSFGILKLQLDAADLLMDARTKRSKDGSGSTVVNGRLRGAALDFEGAIKVEFAELSFRSEEGKKLEVDAKDAKLTFSGPLNFINSLQSILPANGFDDPPFLTVDGQGVVAGYTLGVPSIGIGIFSLQNIALSAALSVPFTDRPAGVRFSVSERHSPFLLTVSGFGGGGFFGMAISANGLEQVEASLEFGGNVSINIVVASGGVFVMAGIYFGLTGTSVTLTGYLRCGGSLEVLGLIAISVEFYLAFTYRDKTPGGSEVFGQASLTVSVKIAFFSKSLSLSIERHFAGADGDPSFADSVTAREWATYLQAFAQ